MRGKANRLPPRLANLCARNFITSAKANMARGRRNRRLPSACRKRGARESNCRRHAAENPLIACAVRPGAIMKRGNMAEMATFRGGGRARHSGRCGAKATRRLRRARFRARHMPPRSAGLLQNDPSPRAKRFAPKGPLACQRPDAKPRGPECRVKCHDTKT
jgi:hypothetical protein